MTAKRYSTVASLAVTLVMVAAWFARDSQPLMQPVGTSLSSARENPLTSSWLSDLRHDQFERDLFYVEKKVPRPNRLPAVAQALDAPPVPDVSTDVIQPVAMDMSLIKYMGYLLHGGKTQALLLVSDEPIVVTVGDRVASRLQVKRISKDSMVLQDDEGRETRLDLSEES